MSESLGAALPQEIERVRKLRDQYIAIGPAGAIGALMMLNSINNAISAMAEGDTVAMIRCYEDLKGFTE